VYDYPWQHMTPPVPQLHHTAAAARVNVATHANALRPMNVSLPSPKVLVPVQRMNSRLRGNDGLPINACPKMMGHGDSSSYCRPRRGGDLLMQNWIPAFAGMTWGAWHSLALSGGCGTLDVLN
jgi:hypothetical protein